jgi:tetratricopeptide (TPR) repeat protein
VHNKKGWILLILFVLTILLRKAGFAGTSILLTGVTLFFLYHLYKYREKEGKLNIFLILFLSVCVLFLQSGMPPGPAGIIFLISWMIFVVMTYSKIIVSGFRIALSMVITFVLLTASLFNARSFHNFYRSNYYEEYIRSKYTEQEGIIADLYIDRNKNPDKIKSEEALKKAMEADSLNKNETALKLYNRGIDLDPDNAYAYHRRGYLKLNKLELDADMAYSAIKDFDRAIRLQPGFTLAYFHRYLAADYLDLKGRAFLDRKKVWEADSILSETDFLNKYGISKTSFSKPFHP